MRLSLCVVLGTLLAGAQSSIVARKDTSDINDLINQQNTGQALLPTVPPPTSDPPSNASPTPSPSDGGGDGGDGNSSTSTSTSSSSSTSVDSSDQTITSTTTVTAAGAESTVTKLTTDLETSTTTVFATSTVFVTVTVTNSNEDTATKIVYSTTTVTVNKKRSLSQDLPTPALNAPAHVEAVPTGTPLADIPARRGLEKRATKVVFVTVTVTGKGGATTITNTLHKTVVSTTSAATTTTSTITSTEQINAKTTITTTSVLTVTSTIVSNGLGPTITDSSPSSEPTSPAAAGSDGSSGGGGSSSKGLSTGAKIGIGVGAGAGGLAILGSLLWLVMRRRNHGYSPDPDDLVGASEVPIGPSSHPPVMGGTMSSNAAAASALLGTGRHPPGKPVSAEGYRGTAMGDGRAGFAKPDTYSAPYPSVSPAPTSVSPVYGLPPKGPEAGVVAHSETLNTAELGTDGGAGNKWYDPNASEIDSRPIMSHQSGPVYEMPTQNYR
ncbi:hypothetical protein ESCO_002748 [Escovopsis weberi]|uniref:Uncharacterized protein n=1 Tax=Escovopsis weberi TaxID=150374 RepID=A0A0N0RT54_ESCWE|nr:hypothetical protein ESCO_002748 [Escovopsis weberi]